MVCMAHLDCSKVYGMDLLFHLLEKLQLLGVDPVNIMWIVSFFVCRLMSVSSSESASFFMPVAFGVP